MRHSRLPLILAAVFMAAALPRTTHALRTAAEGRQVAPAYILIHSDDQAIALEIMDRVVALGGWHLHLMPPDMLLGYLPPGITEEQISPEGYVTLRWDIEDRDLIRGVPPKEDGLFLTPDENAFLFGWRKGRSGRFEVPRPKLPPEGADLEGLGPADDLVISLSPERRQEIRALERRRIDLSGATDERERGPNQNSEYMIGRIVANIILPESQGSTENWSSHEIQDVKGRAIAGWTAYSNHFFYASVDVIYRFRTQIAINIEPSHYLGSDSDWIKETMAGIGYSNPDAPDPSGLVHFLNTDERKAFFADWAYTAFVADASGQPNHYMANSGESYVAYALLGGPYCVNPYPAGRFDVDGFDHVLIHETSHLFFALDEYSTAPLGCSARSGYLSVRNGNSYITIGPGGEVCGDELDCIMNNFFLAEGLKICKYTAGQVGVADDGNFSYIPRVWDVPPKAEFDGGDLDTLLTLSGSITGRAYNPVKTNRNPWFDPEERIDYAPPLFRGKYIRGGQPRILEPDDGKWNSSEERFTVEVKSLIPGENFFEFVFTNKAGVPNNLPIIKTIFVIGINFTIPSVVTHAGANEVKWRVAGADFGAEYTLLRKEEGPEAVWEEIGQVLGEESEGQGFKNFVFMDEDVDAGQQYTYQVRGNFDFPYKGEVTAFEFLSPERSAYAQAPLGGGNLSDVLPNPMTHKGVFTFQVPLQYKHGVAPGGGSPGVTNEVVLTATNVAVYNVRGERVKTIHNGGLFGGRYTWVWDGTDERGRRVSSGVYFIRAAAGQTLESKKVVLIE